MSAAPSAARSAARSVPRRVAGLAAVPALALLCALVAASPGPARAAAGDLDPGFGHQGVESIRIGNDVAGPIDVALQPDGRILVSVALDNTPAATQAFGVVRLNASGAPDKTFGRQGVASANFTNFINAPHAMALQADGRIVVVGAVESADATLSEFGIVRFMRNGVLDAHFGQGGKVTTNFVGVQAGGVDNPATSVVVQPDGRIVVAGAASTCADCVHRTAIARYLADGSTDTSFGTNGRFDQPLIGAPNALAVLSNGHLLALAGTQLAEFDAAGALVTVASTTGGASIAAQRHTGDSTWQPDGRVLLAATGPGPFGPHDIDIQCSRLEPLGNRDVPFLRPIFDFVAVPTGPAEEAPQAVATAADGQFVVGGISNAGGLASDNFGIARLNADGSLDTAFGHGGRVTTVIADRPGLQFSFVSAIAVQPDGRVVAVGLTGNGQGQTFLALARYLAQ